MDANLTEMVFILDMSGSMSSLRDDTIGGYNTLIEEQKKQEGEAFVTTVVFDDRYIVLHDRTPLKDVKPMTEKEYCPLGMTAMLDAVGKTIISVGQKLAALPEEERPGKVMVTIITDGYENSSKEYTWKQVQSMIKEQREKYNWIFSFIGANIDVAKVTSDLGIDARLSKSYTASKKGTDSVYKAMSFNMSFARGNRKSTIDDSDIDRMSETMNDIE